MRIVIFAGGTGSIALQNGLYGALDTTLDGIDTKIIVNAYDNGFSTGAVRKVMNGQILGPSDVRKNQATRLQLKDPDSPWLRFLNDRITVDASKARDACNDKVSKLIKELENQGRPGGCDSVLYTALHEYFKSPSAVHIAYKDFSLANVIYAGLARANGNSLRAAATIIAEAAEIADDVLLNDDKSLFLGAITQSGQKITDEAEIVAWGKETDPFVDIFFIDVDGRVAQPELCLEAWRAIVEADLVILSSGTQWSSLIPTYASDGFTTAISDSKARILMVMNRSPDKDSPGQTASDIINILVPRYFDVGRLHVLADKHGHPNMRSLTLSARSKVASFTQSELSGPAESVDKHNPRKLADAIGYVFFKEYLDCNFYLFDYDDTLVGRGIKYPKSSRFNVKGLSNLNRLTNVAVCTGNTIKAMDLTTQPPPSTGADKSIYKPLVVFADGGVNEYLYYAHPLVGDEGNRSEHVKCIRSETLLPAEGPHSANRIIEALRRSGIPPSKIDNRGNAVIAIKPIDSDYRHAVLRLAKHIISGSFLEVRESGRTTVEICKPELSKLCTLKYLHAQGHVLAGVTYVGDEIESGNDHDIEELATKEWGVRCLRVSSPAKTAFFIATLVRYLAEALRQ